MLPLKLRFAKDGISGEEKIWKFDALRVSNGEWRQVREYCDLNPFPFFVAVGESDVEACEAAFWLVCRQNGEPAFNIGERPFGLIGFVEAMGIANAEAEAEEKKRQKEKEEREAGKATRNGSKKSATGSGSETE